ncbi:MAG: hypothetical protein ACRD45_17795 [Bryobacteraceae bacterium]
MGLSWQQAPLAPGAIGRFLMPEPLRRRLRVRFGEKQIADNKHVLLLFEPGRYPMAYCSETDISAGIRQRTEHRSYPKSVALL